ncbi:hypothetical protein QQF64_035887, partial [Cirrhinus molitorella]
MMASVEELLLDSLKELSEAELKEFHWRLMKAYRKRISKSEMEKADIFDTVDKIVVCFGLEEAVNITVDILRKMNQNNLAEQLENKHKQGSTSEDSKASLYDYTEINFRLKKKLIQSYKKILVGSSQRGHRKYLNNIYTDLYVVENETGGRVNDHE